MRRRDLSTALIVTAAGAAALQSTAQAQTTFPPQDIRHWGTIDPTGVADSTATIKAWLASGGTTINGNVRGKLFCPPGTYKVTSGLTIGLDQTLDCTGVIFNFSSASTSVVAITLSINAYDFALGDPLGGITIVGPGAGTSSVGIKLHGGTAGPVVYMAMRLGSVTAFGTGILFGNCSRHFGVELPG
jgi:hypothetical protein